MTQRLSPHCRNWPWRCGRAATATLLSPFLPLLFMGEEYAEPAPFQFFTSFPDPALGKAVSEGRRKEFERFAWAGEVPDPQAPSTFERSHIDWALREREPHASMLGFYKRLLDLRRTLSALNDDPPEQRKVVACGETLVVERFSGTERALLLLRPSREGAEVALPEGSWSVILDSWAEAWAGPLARPLSEKAEHHLALQPWHAVLAVPG